MKKILKVSVLLICVFLITGCFGTKKLTCTNKMDSETNKTTVKYVFTYKKDKLVRIQNDVVGSFNDKKLAKSSGEDAEEYYSKMDDVDGITAKVKVSGKKVTAKLDMKFEKMSKKDIENAGYNNLPTYAEAKEEMEEDGFTCR